MNETLDNTDAVPRANIHTYYSAKGEVELAGIGQRIGARCIDFVLWFVCVYIGWIVINFAVWYTPLFSTPPPDLDEENSLEETYFETFFEDPPPMFSAEYWKVLLVQIHNPLTYFGLVIGQAMFLLLQGYFLAKHGQTIGKRQQKIVIIDRDTHGRIPFGQLYLRRYLVFETFYVVSAALDLVFRLVDLVFLFRDDRRTIHDMVANTIVVKQSSV